MRLTGPAKRGFRAYASGDELAASKPPGTARRACTARAACWCSPSRDGEFRHVPSAAVFEDLNKHVEVRFLVWGLPYRRLSH